MFRQLMHWLRENGFVRSRMPRDYTITEWINLH